MKIYTKTGDSGVTSLIGGRRVPKYDRRIEAYGTVDELISWLGLIRDQSVSPDIAGLIIEIQDRLMTCASILATDCDDCKDRIPALVDSDIRLIEETIDKYENELEPLSSFILPGGHTVASYCHLARSVCRRAERIVLRLSSESGVDGLIITYLNRLSDFFFVLARKMTKDFGSKEIQWNPRL